MVIKLTFFLSPCQRERIVVSHGDRDTSVDRPDPDLDGNLLRAEKEHKRRVEKEKDRREDRDKRKRERNDRDEQGRGRDRERLSQKQKIDHMAEDSGAEPLLDADQNFGMRLCHSLAMINILLKVIMLCLWLILNLSTYLIYFYLS